MQQEVAVGMKFTRLTVVSQVGNYKRWNCVCDCGNTVDNLVQCHLLSGNTRSCGCIKKEVLIERNLSHGMSKRPEYSHWKDMLKRCFNKKNKRYELYAGKGITVHEDFIRDFPAWLAEIGDKPPTVGRWSVGRIDNNLSYTYGNMRWELDAQQARNHSKQSNNTSGIVGVGLRSKKVGTTEYRYWIATWNTLDGRKLVKGFSIEVYGYDEAKILATNYRNKMIEQLNEQGADYAASHGTDGKGEA